MGLIALLGGGVAVALFAAALSWLTYQDEVAEINRDFAWHVMWRERIWGEWRSDGREDA